MKKIIASLAVVALVVPALANAEDTPAAPAAAPSAAAEAPAAAAAAPTAGGMAAPATATMEKTVELQDGSWAKVGVDGKVKTSKDNMNWTDVAAGTTLPAKDGSTITAK